MKQENIKKLLSSGIVAVVRQGPKEQVMDVISALVDGGITAIELTMDSEDVLNKIKEARERFGHKAVIGAGTVLDSETASSAIQNGAEFIFAPTLDQETIRVGNRYGKIVIPGVFTPTEILHAYEWGADIVKVFPASVLGPKFIKDVRGPLGHIPIIPTGGLNLGNVGEYVKAGAVAVGVGGSLLRKELIANKDWKTITDLATEFVAEVEKARN